MKKRFPSCILATCCIPWNEDWSLAEGIFRRYLRSLLNNLTRDIYLFGTAGEGYAVTDGQFDRIIRVFWEEMSQARARPMLGIISLSLGTILERIERARGHGFRCFQISLPSWGALNDRELMTFFQEVCGGFPDCSFLHYNLPRAKRLVTPEEYAKLAGGFPNLVATKNGTDSLDRINGLMSKAPELQHFFTEAGYGQGALLGECGFLISVASMNYGLAREYFDAGSKRDVSKLLELQRELTELTRDLIASAGDGAHMDGAYDKLFCKVHAPEFPLRLLPPYSTFSDETFQRLRRLIREKYPRWLETRGRVVNELPGQCRVSQSNQGPIRTR
jgi:dihydrodipicolinate synthase/N-acetylneuraminate lyase